MSIRRRGGSSRVLGQIPGQYVVEIDAGLFGRFRVTYRPYQHPRPAWQSGWFWIAEAAERLDPND